MADLTQPQNTELRLSPGPLINRILDNSVLGVFDQSPKRFLPNGFVKKIVTRDAVIANLKPERDSNQTNDEVLIHFILHDATIIFAIIVRLCLNGEELYRCMRRFQENNFTDNCLPVKEEDTTTLRCFEEINEPSLRWNLARTELFIDIQFGFLAPVFSRAVFRMNLETQYILPFIEKDSQTREGAFSYVFRALIHETHQADLNLIANGSQPYVAIKKIRDRRLPKENKVTAESRQDKEWENEVGILEKLRTFEHMHLVRGLAAFEYDDDRYLMFQWADGGSLRDLWEEIPNPRLDTAFVREIVHQFRGLVDALRALHYQKVPRDGFYTHGDLKPENVLRFTDSTRIGVLKIADMGLTKQHYHDTRLRSATSTRFGTILYQPPEAINAKQVPISRKYDIWSLGCITLETIIWLLYGYEQLKTFNNNLRGDLESSGAYYTFPKKSSRIAILHPHVSKLMTEMMTDDLRCRKGTALGDLLDIVKTKLLVVRLAEYEDPALSSKRMQEERTVPREDATTRPPVESRGTADDFLERADAMISRGNMNETYWFTEVKGKLPRALFSDPARNSRLTPEDRSRYPVMDLFDGVRGFFAR